MTVTEPLSFLFPNTPGLEKVRTGIVLDARGAKLTVVGQVPCHCGGHDINVVVQYVMKGRGNEDPHRLNLVERMIRGSCPQRQQDAAGAAMELTSILVQSHLAKQDSCRKVA
jgi:hypothetical protein